MSATKRKAAPTSSDADVSDASTSGGGKRTAVASDAEPNIPIKKEPHHGNGNESTQLHQTSTSTTTATEVKQQPHDTNGSTHDNGVKREDEYDAEEELKYSTLSHLTGLQRDSAGNIICPYLDTINRHLLDFDFEKICSVSLATQNVYACLTCGKSFQGRGKKSIAYSHALDTEHHIYINLHTEDIYCLPDGYQIHDSSLDDIKYNLQPKYTLAELSRLDQSRDFIHALDGTDYLPGLIGLNNIKKTDWLNVIIQALNFIPMLRNYFLVEMNKKSAVGSSSVAPVAASSSSHLSASSSASSSSSPHKFDLAIRYSELLGKIWNPRSFKGHVSPHELLQSISALSGKQFVIGTFADALQVLAWMLHELHKELAAAPPAKSSLNKQHPSIKSEPKTSTSTSAASSSSAVAPAAASSSSSSLPFSAKPKSSSSKSKTSIITDTFQGELRITTTIAGEAKEDDGDMMDDGTTTNAAETTTVEHRPFLYLSLALPAAPLFHEHSDKKAILPQVPLYELLQRFDGSHAEVDLDPITKRERRRTYQLTKLPPYLIIHYQRFLKNTFFWEKNPTLVSFPLENLELQQFVSTDAQPLTEEVVRAMSVQEIKAKLRERKVQHATVNEKFELVSLLMKSDRAAASTRYSLLSNIVHDGKPNSGSYKCHSLHTQSQTWYTTEDLHVWTTDTMPQQIALSEAYIQIYQRQTPPENSAASSF